MAKASDNAFPSILITEGTEPSAPAAGKQRLYIDSTTHKLKRTDSSGVDVTIESTAGNTLSRTAVYRATDQNVSGSATFTAISWSNEDEDTDGVWAIGTPTKFVIPAGLNGRRAKIVAQVEWTASTAGDYRQLTLYLGGIGGTLVGHTRIFETATLGVVDQVQSKVLTLATAQEYELYIRTNTTGIGAIGGAASTWMELYTVD